MSRAIGFGDAESISDLKCSGNVNKLIGIVLYDGFSLLEAGTLAEALQVANEQQPSKHYNCLTYNVRLVSARGGAIACSSSVCVWTERLGGQRFRAFDALYVAGGAGVARATADEGLVELLRVVCSQSVAINSLGNGHALLTAAGVSSRNWASVDRDVWPAKFQNPPARTQRGDALLTALALIKRDLGVETATVVADQLAGGPDQDVPAILGTLGTATLAEKAHESARWLERNCGDPISVVDAARTAAMSERNFLRLFKREIGLTPSQYLLRARLNLSCELLTHSDLPIDKIARRTGLSNGERLSKLFRRQFSMSPTEFRFLRRDNGAV
jgi:transcriptional regulator GlxA family with amidase domain